MRFYLDENIAVGVAVILRATSHVVITARDAGALRVHDDEHLFNAMTRRCVLVSHDNDCSVLHRGLRRWAAWWGRSDFHEGILITPDNLSSMAEAHILDIFAAGGLPTVNELYEWKPRTDWLHSP